MIKFYVYDEPETIYTIKDTKSNSSVQVFWDKEDGTEDYTYYSKRVMEMLFNDGAWIEIDTMSKKEEIGLVIDEISKQLLDDVHKTITGNPVDWSLEDGGLAASDAVCEWLETATDTQITELHEKIFNHTYSRIILRKKKK